MSTDHATPRRTKVASLGHGRGSLWIRKDGSYYHVYSSDGHQHEVRLAARNKTAALKEITDRLAKHDTGRLVAPSSITFGDVWDEFIAVQRGLLEEGRRSRRTIELYEQRYAAHLKPAFGSRRFQQLTPRHVADLLTELRGKPGVAKRGQKMALSSNTRNGILRLASAVFSFGVSRGYRTDNPIQYLAPQERPTAKPATKARALTDDECSTLIAHTRPGLRTFVSFLALTGVRVSEGLGARWGDIDLEAGVFTVSAQLERRGEGDEPKLKSLKSESGYRRIDLHPALVELLRKHRQEALAAGHHSPESFVFCTADGRPHGHRNTGRDISTAATRAGLNGEGLRPVSPHMLRHTFASRLIALGLDVVEVARQLGDKPATLMTTYAQAFQDARRRDEIRDRIASGTNIALG
jgi:integrase